MKATTITRKPLPQHSKGMDGDEILEQHIEKM
jgi:hypothetical protein